jgi:hypothetical protein
MSMSEEEKAKLLQQIKFLGEKFDARMKMLNVKPNSKKWVDLQIEFIVGAAFTAEATGKESLAKALGFRAGVFAQYGRPAFEVKEEK